MKTKADVMKELGRVRRRKIVIEKSETSKDSIGQTIKDWIHWREVFAERDSLYGDEYYAAKAVNQEDTLILYIRYAPFIGDMDSINYRIVYGHEVYRIDNIDYLKDDGMTVKIRATRRGAESGNRN